MNKPPPAVLPPPPSHSHHSSDSIMSVHRIMDNTNRQLPHPPAAALGGMNNPGPLQPAPGNGRIYRLEIVQQPSRARMCGFGDKDRRPITPPPCIRLRILDAATQRPIDVSEIETQYFILQVDLWSADGQQEANLVRHSSTSPSISAATATSYPPEPSNFGHGPVMGGPPGPQYYMGNYDGSQNAPPGQYIPQQRTNMTDLQQFMQRQQTASREEAMRIQHEQQQLQNSGHHHQVPKSGQALNVPAAPGSYMTNLAAGGAPTPPGGMPGPYPPPLMANHMPMNVVDPRASGMYTRNLIGNLAVGSFKLQYPDGDLGVWFVLQDLSVRTEGHFRLKLSFMDVGKAITPPSPSADPSAHVPVELNRTSCPVLATAFSTEFQVFSAKKFPGVVDSTELSKAFAKQGIKIPIRKDGVRGFCDRPRADRLEAESSDEAFQTPPSKRTKRLVERAQETGDRGDVAGRDSEPVTPQTDPSNGGDTLTSNGTVISSGNVDPNGRLITPQSRHRIISTNVSSDGRLVEPYNIIYDSNFGVNSPRGPVTPASFGMRARDIAHSTSPLQARSSPSMPKSRGKKFVVPIPSSLRPKAKKERPTEPSPAKARAKTSAGDGADAGASDGGDTGTKIVRRKGEEALHGLADVALGARSPHVPGE